MKKIKFSGKLSLNKETIAKLNDGQMSKINGGGTILTTLYNCQKQTAVGCATAGVTCACPTVSLASQCVAACPSQAC